MGASLLAIHFPIERCNQDVLLGNVTYWDLLKKNFFSLGLIKFHGEGSSNT